MAAGYLRRGKIAATVPVKLDQQAHRAKKGSGRRPPTTFNPDLYRRVARELGRPHGYRISTLPTGVRRGLRPDPVHPHDRSGQAREPFAGRLETRPDVDCGGPDEAQGSRPAGWAVAAAL